LVPVLSAAHKNPHQTGPAYVKRFIVVVLQTVCIDRSSRSFALSCRGAYNELAQLDKTSSIWDVTESPLDTVTPRTYIQP